MTRRATPTFAATVAACLGAGALAAGTAQAQESAACTAGPDQVTDEVLESHDGTAIAYTVMRPGIADCRDVPVIMHGHGWAGSRLRSTDAGLAYGLGVQQALDAGYAVVSIDARGHGDSGELAHGMQPDLEIRDYSAVIDALARLDWVQPEPDSGIADDIVVAGAGGSYGGGWQILTSIFDERMDAIVPLITWSNLANSFSPNAVPRTTWLSLLQAGGTASARVDPRISQWYFEGLATASAPPASTEYFTAAAPDSYPERMRTPALYVQGLPDTLFTLNEAVSNHLMTRANDVDTWLVGVNTGHVLPGVQPLGLNGFPREGFDRCAADLGALMLDFYDAHLRDDAAARNRLEAFPRVALGIENGGCAIADAWPVEEERLELALGSAPVPQGAGTLLLPALTPDEDVTIAGIPRLRGNVAVPSTGNRFFASLVTGSPDGLRVLHDQVTPYEVPIGESGEVAFDLQGVASNLAAGEQLFLRLEGQSAEWFAGMQSRTGTAMLVTDLVLELPVTARVVGAQDTSRPAAPVTAPAPVEAAPAAAPAPSLPATGGGAAAAAIGLLALARAVRRDT